MPIRGRFAAESISTSGEIVALSATSGVITAEHVAQGMASSSARADRSLVV
jgi:hypothetical protein